MTPGIYFVRHGETDFDTGDARMQGWHDVHLNENGRQQALELAERLKNLPITKVITSDLFRAVQTAAKLVPPTVGGESTAMLRTVALRPWNIGGMTNKPESEGVPVLKDFAFNRPEEPVTDGIVDGESFHDFQQRFLQYVRESIVQWQAEGQTTVHVTHSRNLELLKAAVYADPDAFLGEPFPLVSITRLFHDGVDWQLETCP